MRTYITLSKAGHYTVTIKANGRRVFKQNLISNLITARQIAKDAIKELNERSAS